MNTIKSECLIKLHRTISIFGLGPVGLVTAVCFAKAGNKVIGIDPDIEKLETIRRKEAPFFEPRLEDYLARAIDDDLLQLSNDPSDSSESEFAYIVVGTPADQRSEINLGYVRNAAIDIGRSLRNCKEQQIVVVKSTVTPGTARNLVQVTVARNQANP